jgi:hypothetical protein
MGFVLREEKVCLLVSLLNISPLDILWTTSKGNRLVLWVLGTPSTDDKLST